MFVKIKNKNMGAVIMELAICGEIFGNSMVSINI
jgi:hypothetical protein